MRKIRGFFYGFDQAAIIYIWIGRNDSVVEKVG